MITWIKDGILTVRSRIWRLGSDFRRNLEYVRGNGMIQCSCSLIWGLDARLVRRQPIFEQPSLSSFALLIFNSWFCFPSSCTTSSRNRRRCSFWDAAVSLIRSILKSYMASMTLNWWEGKFLWALNCRRLSSSFKLMLENSVRSVQGFLNLRLWYGSRCKADGMHDLVDSKIVLRLVTVAVRSC